MTETRDRIAEESDADLQAFVADPKWVHYAGMLLRPGVMACAQDLEHAHYDPNTPRNDLFNLRLITFAGLRWALISIPWEERSFMERAATANGLRVANGYPMCFDPEGLQKFPVGNDRVFTLENVRRRKPEKE